MERNSGTGLAGLVGVVLALVIGLHQTGAVPGLAVDWSDPIGWVLGTAPELVIGGLLRQLGLVLGYWVLASTTVYALARIGNLPISWARFATLPLARRLVDRAMAMSLAVSLAGSPLVATAAEAPIAFEVSGDGIPVPHVRVIEPAPDEPSPAAPAADEIIAAPTVKPMQGTVENLAPASAIVTGETTHVVVAGDNLWTIAAAHLDTAAGPAGDPGHIAAYWQKVIEANSGTLRSGDPNLIYPGEIIALPPVGAAQ